MIRLNVRCCCQPTKILGTLPVLDPAADWIRTMPAERPKVRLPDRSAIAAPAQYVEIRIRSFTRVDGVQERAIYSDDRSLEFWHKLPAFREGDQIG